jgi:large subunit ribosomal protein L30
MASRLTITYAKSAIGYSRRQKDTIRTLGLRSLGDSVTRPDTLAVRGLIASVRHLVEVAEELSPEAVEVVSRSVPAAPTGVVAARRRTARSSEPSDASAIEDSDTQTKPGTEQSLPAVAGEGPVKARAARPRRPAAQAASEAPAGHKPKRPRGRKASDPPDGSEAGPAEGKKPKRTGARSAT